MKMRRQVLCILLNSFFLGGFPAYAGADLTLSQAWQKAKEKSYPILAQRKAQEALAAKGQVQTWWDDPNVEFSSGPRTIGSVKSQVQEISLRQRLPTDASRSFEKLAIHGALASEALKTLEIEKEQENKFVRAVYGFKTAKIEREHITERLQRITAIQAHLNKTRAYTPSSSLERTLVQLRIKEIEQKKAAIENSLSLYQNKIRALGLNPEAIEVSWLSAETLKRYSDLSDAQGLNEKQQKVQVQTKKAQSEVSVWRPQIDLFVTSSKEIGGAEEKNEAIGLGLTIPLFSGLSPKKGAYEKAVIEEDFQLLGIQQKNKLHTQEIQKATDLIMAKMQATSLNSIKQMESETPSFEQALKRGQISIVQFLDYEDKVHEHIEMFYTNQMQALELLSEINFYLDKSLVEILGV